MLRQAFFTYHSGREEVVGSNPAAPTNFGLKNYSWKRRDATNSDKIHKNEKKPIMNNGTFASPESLMCIRVATHKRKPTAEVNNNLCANYFELV